MKHKLNIAMAGLAAIILGTAGCGGISEGKARKRQAETQNRAAYSRYLVDMEEVNTDREKQGLAPKPILSYGQWSK